MHMNKKNYQAKIKSDLKISFYNDFIEWDVFYFDEIFSFIQTNNFTRSSMNNIKGNVKNIHYGDILVKYNTILEELSVLPYINDGIDITKYKKNAYVKNGDIIIADTAEDYTAGKAIELKNVTSKVLSGLHTFLCRPKIKIAPMYLGYYLNSNQYHNQLIKLLTGVKVYSISKTNIVKTLIALPKSYEEQKKIAECLKSIDDLILQEEDKLEKLKSHKNGLLQKLFPQDNKCMPELRFKRYNQKWEKMTFDNLLDYERPEKYIVESTNYESFGTPVLTANKAFILGYSSEKFGIYKNVPVILFDDFTTDKKFVDFPFKVKSSAIKILKPKGQNNLKFIFELMNNTKFTFTEHKRYYISTYKNIAIFATKNKQEQQKIAECLSSIDDLISAQAEKIEALKQHKKGLLQGLFPSIEEVENE